MRICQIERPLVSTNRIPGLEHKLLQVVRDGSTKVVAVDAVGCMPGDWVICVGSSAAREAAGSKEYPSDLTIIGIIDYWPPKEDQTEENHTDNQPEAQPKDLADKPTQDTPTQDTPAKSEKAAANRAESGTAKKSVANTTDQKPRTPKNKDKTNERKTKSQNNKGKQGKL